MVQQLLELGAESTNDLEAKRTWVRNHFAQDALAQYETLDGKLRLLQTILANDWVSPEETLKLQCLGVTFGDALAQQLGLKWIVVEDEYGRDPALNLEGTSIVLFPLTAISKRVEAGESVEVKQLFDAACQTVARIQSQGVD